MGILMSGKEIAESIKETVKNTVKGLDEVPKLIVVSIGDSLAGASYRKGKHKDAAECGMQCEDVILSDNITTEELKEAIKEYSYWQGNDGIIVQMPLPKHINMADIPGLVPFMADVDCSSSINMGMLVLGNSIFNPCTPEAVLRILDWYKIPTEGKNCVIIGRSNVVGKPMSLLMLQRNATVTVCHTKTENLKDFTSRADIIICAAGKEKLLTGDMVKPGVVVVDVGINRNEQGKICGDVDFESVEPLASYITPVPGGVGLVTRAVLMENVLKAHLRRMNNL